MDGRRAQPVENPRVERVVHADGHNLGNREYPGRTKHPGGAPDVRITSANPRQARRAGFDTSGSRLAADELDGQALERDQMLDRLRSLRRVLPVLVHEMASARRQAAHLRKDNRRLSEQVRELQATLEAQQRKPA
jgi:hypothetical protein